MTNATLNILITDIRLKKVFEASWDSDCDAGCGEEIAEGEEFYFFGDKKKMCSSCRVGIIETLTEELEKNKPKT